MCRRHRRGLASYALPFFLAWVGALLVVAPSLAHHETVGVAAAPSAPSTAAAEPYGAAGVTTAASTSVEQQLLNLVNAERARAGLPPLRLDPVLSDLARLKSGDMVALNYFGHYSPTYGYPYSMEYRAGIRARYMGAENIAAAATVQMAHALLMASPGHRRNILDPRFTDVGLGVASGRWGLVITQLFIGR